MDYISFDEYSYLMNRIAYWLISNNKQFKHRDLYNYGNRVADYNTIITAIRDRGTNYQRDALINEFVECAVHDNTDLGFMPSWVTGSSGIKYYTNTYVDMANRVSAYEVLNGQSPKIVYIKKENTTSKTTDSVLAEFEKYFGKVNSIDEVLTKIRGRGYAYYYNSVYNTSTTIKRIYNKQGVNCTDVGQLLYRLAIALGYEAQFIHVKCKGGDGHIRNRFRKGGDWFYRDGASVLDGNSITSNWCSPPAYTIAYNPSWIFNDLYQ
jgi:hypothetical protein